VTDNDEKKLVFKRDGDEFGQKGFDCDGDECQCPAHIGGACGSVHANCADHAGKKNASVAGCCSLADNYWSFETCDFSTIDAVEHAANLIPGGGSIATDCVAEWNVDNPRPRLIDRKGLVVRTQTCADGEPGCDADGEANGVCAFRVGVCLNTGDSRLQAKGLPACAVTDVATWEIRKPYPDSGIATDAANAVALRNAVAALPFGRIDGVHQERVRFAPPFSGVDVCTDLVRVDVPLRKGGAKAGKLSLKTKTYTAAGNKDSDVMNLVCIPSP
jgi:hypothetical protein